MKQTICIDELRITGKFTDDPDKIYQHTKGLITVVDLKRGDSTHNKVVRVLYKGEPLGTLNIDPRNPEILDPNHCIFKVDNRKLYQSNYTGEIRHALTYLNIRGERISRIAIAVDTVVKDHKKSMQYFMERAPERYTPINGTDYHVTYEGTTGKSKYFRFGRRRSKRFIRGYYKKEEIAKSSGKTYIQEFWNENGLKHEGYEVERFEIEMNRDMCKEYDLNFDMLDNLEESDFLASIFHTEVSEVFVWARHAERAKKQFCRCRKRRPFKLLDFAGQLLTKIKTKVGDEMAGLKIAAKRLYMMRIATGQPIYTTFAAEIAENLGLSVWFQRKVPEWKKEFNKKMKYGKLNYYSNWQTGTAGKLFIAPIAR